MQRQNLGIIKDTDTRNALRFIEQEGLGNPIILDSAPTADDPLIQANEWGVYSGSVYIRVADTIYVITADSTITVT